MFELSVMQIVLLSLLLNHLSMAFLSVYYHRQLTHGAIELKGWALKIAKLFTLVLFPEFTAIGWVSVHFYHHKVSDGEHDTQSPSKIGFWRCSWFVVSEATKVFRSRLEQKDRIALSSYVAGSKRTGEHERWGHRNSRYEPFLAFCVLMTALFGLGGLVVSLVVYCLNRVGNCAISSLVHSPWAGYRNHNTDDLSVNSFLGMFWLAGEEWHNNHHHNPTSSKIGEKWWELDIGWLYIKLFEKLGVCEVKR